MSVTTPTAPAAFEETAHRPLGARGVARAAIAGAYAGRIVSGLLSHGGWSLVVATTGSAGLISSSTS